MATLNLARLCCASLAGQSVATDDGGGVDLVLDQVLRILQQFSSNDHLHSRAEKMEHTHT